jgi:excisionase family DNA binding protein
MPEASLMSQVEVLTIKDVAAILKMAEKTVYSMAQAGELPAFKIRGQWRVRRKDFDDWVERQARARPRKGGPSEP